MKEEQNNSDCTKIKAEINNLIKARFDMEQQKKIDCYLFNDLKLQTIDNLLKHTNDVYERALNKICKHVDKKQFMSQISYTYEVRIKKSEFCDKGLLYLYGQTQNGADTVQKNKKKNATKEKVLTYEIHEKIEGFCTKEGEYLWSDAKIDELVASLMKQ